MLSAGSAPFTANDHKFNLLTTAGMDKNDHIGVYMASGFLQSRYRFAIGKYKENYYFHMRCVVLK